MSKTIKLKFKEVREITVEVPLENYENTSEDYIKNIELENYSENDDYMNILINCNGAEISEESISIEIM